MLSTNVVHDSGKVLSFSDWLDRFDRQDAVTGAELEQFRTEVGHTRYGETVLRLAREGKLRSKVLADAAYIAWLKAENPKKVMSSSCWTELFRLSYLPSHELFEVPEAANSATSLS